MSTEGLWRIFKNGVKLMDKKDILRIVGWIAGTVVWAIAACCYFTQGDANMGAMVALISVISVVKVVESYIRAKK